MRTLTRLRINEVSAVNRGAGEGCEIKIMKSDDDTPLRRNLERMFGDLVKRGKLSKPRDEDAGAEERRQRDLDIDREASEQDIVATEPILEPRLQSMVDALRSADPSLSEQQALHHLLHSPRGRSLADHLASITKKEEPMNPMEKLQQYVKASGGIVGIAKHIVNQGHTPFTEHEFSDLVMEAARREKKAGETDSQAFSRLFEHDLDVRKAHAICKAYPDVVITQPVSIETGATNVKSDADKAAKQIAELVDKQRALAPTLTTSQLYERVYADPSNKALLARAHHRFWGNTSGDELQRE